MSQPLEWGLIIISWVQFPIFQLSLPRAYGEKISFVTLCIFLGHFWSSMPAVVPSSYARIPAVLFDVDCPGRATVIGGKCEVRRQKGGGTPTHHQNPRRNCEQNCNTQVVPEEGHHKDLSQSEHQTIGSENSCELCKLFSTLLQTALTVYVTVNTPHITGFPASFFEMKAVEKFVRSFFQ